VLLYCLIWGGFDTGTNEEREGTRKFFRMLVKRSEEARKYPEALIALG